MKRVSFKVAKAIKEAGYPQGTENTAWYNENGELVKPFVFNGGNEVADAPTYLEVYLWLWDELGIKFIIDLDEDGAKCYGRVNDVIIDESGDDPEEAVITAIEFLIDNNLIQ